jgi:hypothetical protein
MKLFLRLKIYELVEGHGHKVLHTHHQIITISTPLNWFGTRLRDITVATLVKMGIGMDWFVCFSFGVSHKITYIANLL